MELLILRAITNPLRQRKHFSPSVVVETVIQVPAISVTMLSEYGPKAAWRGWRKSTNPLSVWR
jgi:hypothetical protein